MSCNLKEYKEFIDNEMLLILGQMDKATHIFDHVYLVRMAAFLPFRLLCLCSFYIAWAGFFCSNPLTLCLIPAKQALTQHVSFLCRAQNGTLPTWKSFMNAGELKLSFIYFATHLLSYHMSYFLRVNNVFLVYLCGRLEGTCSYQQRPQAVGAVFHVFSVNKRNVSQISQTLDPH